MSTGASPMPIPGPPAVRKCCQCGADDRELPAPDAEDPLRHFVQIELRYLDAAHGLQRAEDQADPIKKLRWTRKGWRFREFQGRKAIERMICMDCLNNNYIADRIDAQYRRDAKKMEKQNPGEQNFYHILCEVEET